MATDPLKTTGIDDNIANSYKYTSINSMNIYDFMDTAYEGSGGFRDGKYLVPHTREMFYDKRLDLCFYKNYTRPIIRAMVEPVFVNPAPRKVITESGAPDESSLFNNFILDCDNAGTHIQEFTEEVMTVGRLHGLVFVIMDNFHTDQLPKTNEEAKRDRKFPYVYLRTAQQVYSYTLDRFGNLKTIVFVESSVTVKNRSGGIKEEKRYRYWDSDVTTVQKNGRKAGTLVDVETPHNHGLGKIPVIVTYTAKRKNKDVLYIDPPLYDIARLNHTIFNKDSEIREIERNQGFSLLYIQSRGGNFTTGTSNVLYVPMEATMPPGFIGPNPAIQKELMENMKEIREALFQIAEQSGVTGVKSAKSGIAIQWDFFAHETVLKKTSSMSIVVEEKMSSLFRLYTKETFVYVVNYPDSFQPNDKLAEVKLYNEYLDIDLPPKARALAKEKITRYVLAGEDEDAVEDAVTEIHAEMEDQQNTNR